MAKEQLLTTVDNPYNPFTEWNEWYAFDQRNGYHTPGLLAKLVVTSDALSEADQEDAIDTAMAVIVSEFGFYKLVDSPDQPSTESEV